ncbi:hydroxyacylglutathione hydrolase [Methylophaga lonarensis MPL]|uniref:Hydroxyacylglutathione hydrolase n=1 Tax=Methylophaga lonarensis MPL TaxID=1286106 RepID=M7NYY4_9GAMM|nr:hydroxyacylglutathione hydrolase [Methylophaga lonarensis]EMR12421.1 hydroxyacylglutathione hydrolase [Methylophaga lonarensis MPL]
MLKVHAVNAFEDNYIWLIQSEHSAETMIVDPGSAEPVLRKLQTLELEPVAILITHHHHDHVGGIRQLRQSYADLPVFGPRQEQIPEMSHPLAEHSGLSLHPAFPAVQILDTPGHTAGHISYLLDGKLFCGDTLFAGGCGRLLGGTAEQLYASLLRLRQLPAHTEIYCAHEYTLNNLLFALSIEPDNQALHLRLAHCRQLRAHDLSTVPSRLADELQTNPFLRCDQPSVACQLRNDNDVEPLEAIEVFRRLRSKKDVF